MLAFICLLFAGYCEPRETPPPSLTPAVPTPTMEAPSIAAPAIDAPKAESLFVWDPDCRLQPPLTLAVEFDTAGRKNMLDPCLLARQAWVESKWDPEAVSPAGSIGIAQFQLATAAELGIDPWDPHESIRGQARYLRWSLDRWNADFGGQRSADDHLRIGLATYNYGVGNMLRTQEIHGWVTWEQAEPHMPSETQRYVRSIMEP